MAAISGWSFPVEPVPATGRIRMAEGGEAVRQGIRILLETERGERRMLPTFGGGLSQYMFEAVDFSLVHDMSERIVETVQRWERYVDTVSAEVSRESGGVRAEVSYRTKLSPGRERLETHIDLSDISG